MNHMPQPTAPRSKIKIKLTQKPYTESVNSYQKQSGFTLIELLVAMTLLSLVMLGMASALQSMAQLEERVDARLEQLDELRVATGFVGQVLGRLSARQRAGLAQEGRSPFFFEGEPHSVAWLGVMPARHGAGGLHFFRLALEEGALVLRFAPWRGEGQFPSWEQAEHRTLVRAATALTLSYEDSYQPAIAWVPQWQRKDGLPQHVRIDLQTPSGDWPLWIVPTRTLLASQAGKGRFSMGPGE